MDDPIELALRPDAAPSGSTVDPIEQALNPANAAPKVARAPIAVPEAPKPAVSLSSIPKAALDVIGGAGETVAGTVLGGLGSLAGGAASWAGRAIGGDWDTAQKWADKVQQEVSTVHGLYGEPETETGKAIKSGLNWVGGKLSQVSGLVGQKVLDVTGSPTAASVADAATQVLPALAVTKLAQRVKTPTPVESAPQVAAPLAPTAESITKAPVTNGEPIVGGLSKPEVAQAIKAMPDTIVADATPIAEAADFVPGKLDTATQADRAAVLSRVGHDNARLSALQGDGPQTMFENDLAKSPDPKGQLLRAQFDKETATNQAFANQILQKTGGSVGLDQNALYGRGQTINNAWDALRQWHENQVNSLYSTARERLGDTPVSLDSLAGISTDPAKVSGTVQGIAFKNQLDSVMQKLGIATKDEEGNIQIQPTSVNNAERLRQWMNASWTPETSGFIGELKNALDSDVTKSAGDDVFAQARAARALQAKTLDSNKGISRIFDSNGSNRAVALENVPDAVTRLSNDQLAHVVNVFSNMPEGLQPLGTQAVNEIAAHYANKLIDAGSPQAVGGRWSNIQYSKYLNANNAKMSQVFTPQGMGMINDLNQAGKILGTDQRYVGAAAQGDNFARAGLTWALPKATAAAGGFLGSVFGPAGAATGAVIGSTGGQAAVRSLTESAALKRIQKKIVPLGSMR